MAARTLYDKLWDAHVIDRRSDGSDLLYVDRHFVHDACFPGFDFLDDAGRRVRRPDLTFGMEDHYIATRPVVSRDASIARLGPLLASNASKHGFMSFGANSDRQGIVHVVGPEAGLTLPGSLVVCGDSHTATHGALGCLAFGVGASEIYHVLSTQAIWQKKSGALAIDCLGSLSHGVTAKDLILGIIASIGAKGGTGYVIEYRGAAIEALSIEARMTVCNMSIEAGAKAGLIAPDSKTLAYLRGRPFAPKDDQWEAAAQHWSGLRSDAGAMFTKSVTIDASKLAPQVTWGTSPETGVSITECVPEVETHDHADREHRQRMLDYMGLEPGQSLREVSIDQVFIGSCTNSRIEDLRLAASVLEGRSVRAKVPALVVPGSVQVQQQAEREGLDRIFKAAGFEWASPGCSMCVAMNGDLVGAGKRSVSTSNRNFMGRQGPGSRTHLASPLTAAASALTGYLTDVREMI